LRLQLAPDGPRSASAALAAAGSPLLHGVPGFVLGADMKIASLLVTPPAGARTLWVKTSWAQGNAWITFEREEARCTLQDFCNTSTY